jgi:hypothetical protein
MELPTYDIWAEGYSVTGDHGSAVLLGTARGANFKEACIEFFADPYGLHDYKSLFDTDRLTYWGCHLFSNESAARKSFG